MKSLSQTSLTRLNIALVLAFIAALAFWKLSIILFIGILLLLVIIHEFGHFVAAKWVGMRVDEFAFGFPPRIFAKKKGETVYAVNALPIGGYVSIWGENGEPDDEAKRHPRAFGNKPKWAQLVVLGAGVFMNMLLALFIYIGISFGSVQMSVSDPTYGDRVKNPVIVVAGVTPNSPAVLAGIVPGSVITKLTAGNARADLVSATSTVLFVERNQNSPFTVEYIRPDGVRSSTTIAAVYGLVPEKKALGLSLDSIGLVRTSFTEAIVLGFDRTYTATAMTLQGIGGLFVSVWKGGDVLDSLAGPIGIAQVVGEQSSYGATQVLSLVAILSVTLAVFNILPFPALDGGRIVMVAVEAVTRRKIPFAYYSIINLVGIAALLLLFLVVSVNDIWRIFM